MISLPMRRTSGSSVAKRSCSSRWSVSELMERTMFSNGSSSRSSWATRERSSLSSNMTAVRSNGRSSVWRSVVEEAASTGGGSAGGGAVGASGVAAASGALSVSGATSSSSGFSSSSFCTTSCSSSVESCSSWMACCSSGVMTTRWLCRSERRASMAMATSRSPYALEGELLPEIDLPGDRIVGNLAGRPRDEDLAVVEDVGSIGDRERFADVVVGDQDADSAVAQSRDDLLDVGDRDRIDAGEGLVQQQVLGPGDQRPRDLQPPPFPARQRVGGVGRQRGQVELAEQLAGPLPALGGAEVERLEDRQEIFLHRQFPEDRRFLRQIAHAHATALVHGARRDLLSFQKDTSALRRQQADHHVERRRLAGAVRSQQAHDLAALDVQRDVVDDLAVLEPLLQSLGDQAFHAVSSRTRWRAPPWRSRRPRPLCRRADR